MPELESSRVFGMKVILLKTKDKNFVKSSRSENFFLILILFLFVLKHRRGRANVLSVRVKYCSREI